MFLCNVLKCFYEISCKLEKDKLLMTNIYYK